MNESIHVLDTDQEVHQRLENSRLLSLKDVIEVTTLSSSSIYNSIPRGFPKPVKVGNRRKAWRKSEIVEWLESRKQSTGSM